MAAAREGDEEAMESLTLEDIDTYSMISKRIMTEDILSIVDTYFMPYGIDLLEDPHLDVDLKVQYGCKDKYIIIYDKLCVLDF